MYCLRHAFLLSLFFSGSAYSAYASGIIDGVYDGNRVSGWACIKGSSRSIPVHIYARLSTGYKMLGSLIASSGNEAAVDSACQHAGTQGRHRFSYRFTTADKMNYGGKPIYIFGIADQTPHRVLKNSGTFVVPRGKGYIDNSSNISPSRLKGWACIEKTSRSVHVDIYAGSTRIRSVLASTSGENTADSRAIAAECKHSGAGNHRFSVTFNDREKARYAGQRISARVRETQTWLANSWSRRMPGEVSYTFYDNYYQGNERDRVRLSWDYTNTAHCGSVEGTLLSFPGRAGISHGVSLSHVKQMEKVLGQNQGCVRVIRVDVNPGTSNDSGGYWLKNSSYREASSLMTRIIKSAKLRWADHKGQRPAQGKIIVVGSSAGGMIAAAAMEWNADYRSIVDRSIFVSSPLGADLSYECARVTNIDLKGLLDDMFNMPGTCERCTSSQCLVPSNKDVVNVSNKNTRFYLNNAHNHDHQMSILIGGSDGIGCTEGSIHNCTTSWTAENAARDYIGTITGGDNTIFQEHVIPTGNQDLFSFSVINGTHDLWQSTAAKRMICKNALAEVGVTYRVCDSQIR